MSGYKTKTITDPIVEFIKSCPFLEEYGVDLAGLQIQKIDGEDNGASSVGYLGSKMLSNAKDLNARGRTMRQANFEIWLLKRTGHDFYRKDMADFLFNFEQWVEHCQYHGLTPKLSDNINSRKLEFMYADNGAFFSDWEEEDMSLYAIQLHVIYYNDYK